MGPLLMDLETKLCGAAGKPTTASHPSTSRTCVTQGVKKGESGPSSLVSSTLRGAGLLPPGALAIRAD